MVSSLSVLDSLGAAAQQEDEDSYPSTVQTALRHQRAGSPASSHNTTSPGEAFDSDLDESPQLIGSQSWTKAAAAATASHTLSAEGTLLSLQKKTNSLLDISDLSSGPTDPRPGWAKCSSDSVGTSEKPTQITSGVLESFTISEPQASEQADQRLQNDAVGRSAGTDYPLPLSQAYRRAEPEGCSAAADTPAVLPTAVQTPPTVLEEELEVAELLVAPTHDHTPSPTPNKDDGPATAMSNAGSESSLAIRVAELLQRESSAVASNCHTPQQEGSRAAGGRSHTTWG